MKGQMIMTGVRIEKYETRSSSIGAQEFCLDIISSNRKLMLRVRASLSFIIFLVHNQLIHSILLVTS